MKVLVLRPERAAKRTAEALAALGHEAILAPVLTIENLDTAIPGTAFDAVLATSANGLRKLRERPEIARLAELPLIAVGDRTAAAGREAGFSVVHIAEGDGRALVAEAARLFPRPARFMHAAGADRAFDIAGELRGKGHEVAVVELYRATAAERLPAPAVEALEDGAAGAVLHHSGRIAQTFLKLVDDAGLGEAARRLPQAALAERISRTLSEAGCLRVATAARPDEPALLDALEELVRGVSPSAAGRTN